MRDLLQRARFFEEVRGAGHHPAQAMAATNGRINEAHPQQAVEQARRHGSAQPKWRLPFWHGRARARARARYRKQVWRDVDSLCHQQFNATSLVGRLPFVNAINGTLPRHHERGVGALVHEARTHAVTLRNIKAHRDKRPNNHLLPT